MVFVIAAVGITAGCGFNCLGMKLLNELRIICTLPGGPARDLGIQRVFDVAALPPHAAVAAGLGVGGRRHGAVSLPSGVVAAGDCGGRLAGGGCAAPDLLN